MFNWALLGNGMEAVCCSSAQWSLSVVLMDFLILYDSPLAFRLKIVTWKDIRKPSKQQKTRGPLVNISKKRRRCIGLRLRHLFF